MVRTSRRLMLIPKIARDLGISAAGCRLWVQAAQPSGTPPLTDDERSALRRLRRENRALVVGWALRATRDTRLPLAALHLALACALTTTEGFTQHSGTARPVRLKRNSARPDDVSHPSTKSTQT